MTLSDPTPPAAPFAAGALAAPGWHSGPVALAVSSGDPVGISAIHVTDPAGVLLASAAQSCDYTLPVPCPQASGVPLQVDTRQLPDGFVRLTLAATDTAQNSSTSTIDVRIANHPPAPLVLNRAEAMPGGPASASIVARIPSGPVPIAAVNWMLCRSACGPVHAVAVPPGAVSVAFTPIAPSDGAYTVQAYAVDAAGHRSSTATEPLAAGQPAQPPTLTLPSGSNAAIALPTAVGPAGLRLILSLHRRAHRRLELDVRTRPKRAGKLKLSLAFDGHHPQRHTLGLRSGLARLVVPVPNGTATLTVTLAGFGAKSTAHVRLASLLRSP